MNGPKTRRETACIGAVLLSNSNEPTEYFFCKEPIDCSKKVTTNKIQWLIIESLALNSRNLYTQSIMSSFYSI